MPFVWALVAGAALLAIYFASARLTGGRAGRGGNGRAPNQEGRGARDAGANINPDQTGNEVNLWPDRMGARTPGEPGARQGVDMNFRRKGDRRPATAPEGEGDAIDPYAHAPAAGPNRPLAEGVDFPRDDLRP